MARSGKRVRIPVGEIEFVEGGNTIWVHGERGTVLRVQVTGRITSRRCAGKVGPSHADLTAPGDLHFCIGRDVTRAARGATTT